METKIKGVKKGTKRGSYKKRIKDETIINKVDSIETTIENEQKTIEPIIEPIQNEPIIKNEISTTDLSDSIEQPISKSNNSNDAIKQPSERTEFQQTTAEEKLNSFFNEYQQINDEPSDNKNEHPEQRQQDPKLKMIINGYMLLSICDVVFPYGIKFLFGLFNPKAKKVKAKDIQLEPEQRQALLGAADQVAQYVFEKANPMTIFIICMGLFYGTNFSNALNEIKDK
jgi:hypothetical protein